MRREDRGVVVWLHSWLASTYLGTLQVATATETDIGLMSKSAVVVEAEEVILLLWPDLRVMHR
jgi:hypothetical protein